jgi:hypothetical protein
MRDRNELRSDGRFWRVFPVWMATSAAVVLFCALALTGCATRSAEFQPEPGYRSLYNGKDLSGWGYRDTNGAVADIGGKTESADGRYTAEVGFIRVHPWDTSKGPHFRQLWTTAFFPTNFHLLLEFRAGTNADSGLYLRNLNSQLQVRDYYVAGPPEFKALKKYRPQDWNTLDVTVKGNTAVCLCNGELMQPQPALRLPADGHIGLEADRGQMDYRRIRLKEIP